MLKKSFFLKHKIKNKDSEVRLAAIEQLSGDEDEIFLEAAMNDCEAKVRLAAIKKLDRIEMLEELAEKETDPEVRDYLKIKINQIYKSQILELNDLQKRLLIIKKINDERILAELAVANLPVEILDAVAAELKSTEDILYCFKKSSNQNICEKLLDSITEPEVLAQIAESALLPQIREAAQHKLTPPPPPEPVNIGIAAELKERLDARTRLCEEVETLAENFAEHDVASFEAIKERWSNLEEVPPSYQEILEKRFSKACELFNEARAAYEQRLKVRDEMLNRLEHLYIEIVKLTEGREDIETRCKMAEGIAREWNKICSEVSVENEMQERFNVDFDKIQHELKEYQELKKQHIAALEEYCREMEQMAEVEQPENFRERFSELKELFFAETKDVSETAENIIKRFKKAEHLYHRKLNEYFRSQDLERWEHYTLKLDICTAAEKLCEENDMRNVSRKLKELRSKWREIGPVPREKSDELWNRFKGTCDVLFQRCTEFYEQLDRAKVENLKIKTALCEEAENLKDSDEWKNTAGRFKELQLQWRQTGPAASEQDRELYGCFREACNLYFSRRKEHYDKLHHERQNCTDSKHDLCAQAEKLMEMPVGKALSEAKRLRSEWQNTGFAGRADKKLHARFSELLDTFYSGLRNERENNLMAKENACKGLEQLLAEMAEPGSNIAEMREQFSAFKRNWDEAGPVPHSEEKRLTDIFDELCRKAQDKFTEVSSRAEMLSRENYLELERIINNVVECPAGEVSDDKLQQWDKAWNEAGKVPQEQRDATDKFFKNAIDVIQTGDEKAIKYLHDSMEKNLKHKRNICVELEKLVDISPPDTEAAKSGLSLAEELSLAIQNNFAAPQIEMSRKEKIERASRLDKDWLAVGPVPRENSREIFDRYCRARKYLFQD